METTAINSSDCLSFYMSDLANSTINASFKFDNSSSKSQTALNSKNKLEKFHILKEVLSSEKKYLNDLKEIVEGYYEEIYKYSRENDELVYQIFSNIKEIYEFTKSFNLMLETSANDEIGIANCFIKKHQTFFKLYSVYCHSYNSAYNASEKLELNPTVERLIEKVRIKYGHSLRMATYLQLPVLRITKYPLLLQRYLKLVENNTFAHGQIQEALDLMKQVNDQIDKQMPDNQNSMSIEQLACLYGPIIKQGVLFLLATKKYHYVVVFQSALIIKRSSDSSSSILHSISNEFLVFLPVSYSERSSRCFTVFDYNQPKDEPNWQNVFKSKTQEDKQAWQSAILSCILNGYDNKVSHDVINKFMEKDSDANKSSSELIRKKLSSFKRLNGLRSSLKNDFKTGSKLSIFSEKPNFKQSNTIDELNVTNKMNKSIQDLTLNKFKKNIDRFFVQKGGSFKLPKRYFNKTNDYENCGDSIMSESFEPLETNRSEMSSKNRAATSHNLLGIYDQIDSSFNEIVTGNCVEESIKTYCDKIFDEKNFDLIGDFSPNSSYKLSPIKSDEKEESCLKTNRSLFKSKENKTQSSSQSSINSEEGYYSNHDSSISTSIEQTKSNPNASSQNSTRTISSLDLALKMQQSNEKINMSCKNLLRIHPASPNDSDSSGIFTESKSTTKSIDCLKQIGRSKTPTHTQNEIKLDQSVKIAKSSKLLNSLPRMKSLHTKFQDLMSSPNSNSTDRDIKNSNSMNSLHFLKSRSDKLNAFLTLRSSRNSNRPNLIDSNQNKLAQTDKSMSASKQNVKELILRFESKRTKF